MRKLIKSTIAKILTLAVLFSMISPYTNVLAEETEDLYWKIIGIEDPEDIEVSFGSTLEDIDLPETLRCKISDSNEKSDLSHDNDFKGNDEDVDSGNEEVEDEENDAEIENVEEEDNLEDEFAESDVLEIPVEWECEKYEADVVGEYTFTAEIPTNYKEHYIELSADVNVPVLIVRVGEPGERLLEKEIDDIAISVRASKNVIPADVELNVKKIEGESETNQIEEEISSCVDEDIISLVSYDDCAFRWKSFE